MNDVHPELRRSLLKIFVGSVILESLGYVMIIATAIGVPFVSGIPAIGLYTVGGIFVLAGLVGTIHALRRYLRAAKAVTAAKAIPALATIRVRTSSGKAAHVARLESDELARRGLPAELEISDPGRDSEAFAGSPLEVAVILSENRRRVIAIRTPRGMLWARAR